MVAHLAQSLDQHLRACLLSLLFFVGSDPSLDFGVGCLGWEVAGEPLANVGRALEQVARLLPGGGGGGGRSRRGAFIGEGAGVAGEPSVVRGGRANVAGCQAWSSVDEGSLSGVSRALAG